MSAVLHFAALISLLRIHVRSRWRAVPAEALRGDVAAFRAMFPGARSMLSGYGKRTFVTAPARRFSEFILGPVPGPAVVQVIGLSVTTTHAYPADPVVVLALPAGGAQVLSAAIWSDLGRDRAGGPLLVANGPFPGSQFYAARSVYGLLHTCTRWVADMLHAAGLAVAGDGVVVAGQVMARAASRCRPCWHPSWQAGH